MTKWSLLVDGKEIHLEQDKKRVAVRFKKSTVNQDPHKDGPPKSERNDTINRHASSIGDFRKRIEVPHEKFTLLQTEQPDTAIQSLSADAAVAKVNPVFKLGDLTVIPTDRVIVQLKPDANAQEILAKYKVSPYFPGGSRPAQSATSSTAQPFLIDPYNTYVLELAESDDPIAIAKELSEMNKVVEYAQSDLATMGPRLARNTTSVPREALATDPMERKQYAARITRANEAWKLQQGDPEVVIAILDDGVDENHEDLENAIVEGLDGVEGDRYQEPNAWDPHGTACAGLAAAVHQNKLGIKGIGGGCSIMPIRIAQSPKQGAHWSTSSLTIAKCIDYAWRKGADVLSMSWGGGAPSSVIIDAIKRAQTLGRNGKGCVVVVAAGNESGPVTFPANIPNVLTVSASNEDDEFKSKKSSDGEDWWGSNYGSEVGLAAPGVHNLTTDISNAGGYSTKNYITDFNGTSSATPIVAGAAGLLLSAKRSLTGKEAQSILMQTAAKVGSEKYVNGRNNFFGHGRLDVLAAIQFVMSAAPSIQKMFFMTYIMSNLQKVILDKSTTAVTLNIGEDRVISDLEVLIKLTHDRMKDVEIVLIPPQETGAKQIVLHENSKASGDPFEHVFTVNEIANIRGLFGKSSKGAWQFQVTDSRNKDEGVLDQVGLKISHPNR